MEKLRCLSGAAPIVAMLKYRRRNPLGDDDLLRAVVCDCVGPAQCAVMLKLATQTRSRRERDWWRATPGRSGKGAALPLPAESPAEHAARCVTRGRRCARANCFLFFENGTNFPK